MSNSSDVLEPWRQFNRNWPVGYLTVISVRHSRRAALAAGGWVAHF